MTRRKRKRRNVLVAFVSNVTKDTRRYDAVSVTRRCVTNASLTGKKRTTTPTARDAYPNPSK